MQLNEFGGTKLVLEDPVALNLSKITTITDQNFLDFISINYLSIFNKFDDTQSRACPHFALHQIKMQAIRSMAL